MLGQFKSLQNESAPAHNHEYTAINTDTTAPKNCTIKFYTSRVHKFSYVHKLG